MNDRLKDQFQKNLVLFSSQIQKKLLHTMENENIWENVIIEYNDDHEVICKYKVEEHIFHITSEKPTLEVEHWCEHLPIDDAASLFIYGSGFGYPLLELLKRKQPNTMVMVFEYHIDLFIAMMHYFDLTPLFHTQKFLFFLGSIDEFKKDYLYIFGSEVFLFATAPYVVFTQTAQRNFRKEYLDIHRYIFHELSLNVFYLGNDHYDTLLGFHNLITNINEIIENPYLGILKDKYKDFPAFIIANGPSLDKDIQKLKKIDGRGLIISTESAIVPLIKNKIKPDILTIVERTKDSFTYHFENRNYPSDISLIALALIDQAIFPSFPGPRIPLFRNTESINIWMNQNIGDPTNAIDAGANVSHLAFEIAAYAGANPIVFVGQNYAFGPNGVTHSKDAVYLQEKGKKAFNNLKSRPVIYVEGNDGTKIPSIQLWEDFRLGLERKIGSKPNIKAINTTVEGANIKGTTLEKLNTVIDNYCKAPLPIRVNELILVEKEKINTKERQKKLEKLINELSKYAGEYRKLCQLAVKGNVRSKNMIALHNKDELTKKNIQKLEAAYEENFNDIKKFMTDNLYLVFFQQILISGFHKMNRLGVINTPERIKHVFEIYSDLFYYLNLISQSVAITFETAADRLKN